VIWAGAMMLQHLGYPEAHDDIIKAIETVLAGGIQLTPDMGGKGNTAELGKAIVDAI
jgi:tartrate dehydrogenase/decarboxylase/D-malate dehydrogenase